MIKVGVTGGIGSGKSTVCRLFGLLGIPVYEADSRAKALMNNDPVLRQRIEKVFGGEDYPDGGELNRKYIAQKVFSDPALLATLNGIVHPEVERDFLVWAEAQEAPFVIEESAILYESNADKYMDRIIVVTAPEEVRIQRAMRRDGATEPEIRRRMANQLNEQESTDRADYVIRTDDKQLVIPQVLEIFDELSSIDSKR